MKYLRLFIPAVLVAVSGCSSVNGLSDSKSSFGCKAPDGVACTSVSGVYANAEVGNLPALRHADRKVSVSQSVASGQTTLPVAYPGLPIRTQTRVLRVWVAPWVDEDSVMHDQSFMYVVIDPGKWLVESSRKATVMKTLRRLQQSRDASDAEASSGEARGQDAAQEVATQATLQRASLSGEKEEAK